MNDRRIKLTREDYKSIFKVAMIGVAAVCIIIAFYFCLQRYQGFAEGINKVIAIAAPFIGGAVLAFLMNPFMKMFERRIRQAVLPKSKNPEKAKKGIRLICTLLAMVIVVGAIVAFFAIVIPQLYGAITFFIKNIDQQILKVLDWADQITGYRYTKNIDHARGMDVSDMLNNGMEWVQKYLGLDEDSMVTMVTSGVISIGKIAVNSIIAIFASVYILMEKEHFQGQAKKLVYGIFQIKTANLIVEIAEKADQIFFGFIIGKIIDSIIIGLICYIFCVIAGMPYAILVAFIVGVTNIIPVFGPYIGAVPTVIIIFITEPMKGIVFLIFILILQQIDGNLIGPKILGDSTGLSSFWVLFAIVVGGSLFGVFGMILGVPTMSLIYYLVSRYSDYLADKKKLPLESYRYSELKYVDPETGAMTELTEEEKKKTLKIFDWTKKSTAGKQTDADNENKESGEK